MRVPRSDAQVAGETQEVLASVAAVSCCGNRRLQPRRHHCFEAAGGASAAGSSITLACLETSLTGRDVICISGNVHHAQVVATAKAAGGLRSVGRPDTGMGLACPVHMMDLASKHRLSTSLVSLQDSGKNACVSRVGWDGPVGWETSKPMEGQRLLVVLEGSPGNSSFGEDSLPWSSRMRPVHTV